MMCIRKDVLVLLLLLPGEAPVDGLVQAAHRAGHRLVPPASLDTTPDAVLVVDAATEFAAAEPGAAPAAAAPSGLPVWHLTPDELRDEPDIALGRAVASVSPSARPTVRTAVGSGVSHLTPLVTAGGLLTAIGYLFGAPHVVTVTLPVWQPVTSPAALLTQLGWLALALVAPVLGAALAHAIAGRHALVPGVVGGAVALVTGAGYLGGLGAGLIAGLAVLGLTRLRPPRAIHGLWAAMVVPAVATAVTGAAVALALAPPLTALTALLTAWLGTLTMAGGVVAGLVAGMLVALDLGGPISKTVYAVAVAGLAAPGPVATTGVGTSLLAAVMAAGMTPPLAAGVAALAHRASTPTERHQGRSALVLGAAFITEGAIPLATADPMRVLPSVVLGSGVSGALTALFGATLAAPHGGLAVLGLMAHPAGFVAAVTTGTALATALIVGLRSGGATRTARSIDAWSRRDTEPTPAARSAT
jgi:PTS system fructose-specific IIC component